LKHGLLMCGVLAGEWEIGKLTGTTPLGTDETQLERAARHYGFDLPTVRRHDADEARRELVCYLRDGIPCLLCVDQWDHWVTAVQEEKGRFIILDSEKAEVIVVAAWPRLRDLWVYHDRGGGDRDTAPTLFDLHPLIPHKRTPTRARFSLERARHLRDPENRGLAQLWDVYVEDLIALCRDKEPRGGRAVSLGRFIRRHSEMILDQLAAWHGKIDRDAADRVLKQMRFVADTYGLVIRQSGEKRALSAMSMILALWSAGEFGVEPLYRKVPVRKLR
jgi:hypothetical protein